jgi:hypothetical protein
MSSVNARRIKSGKNKSVNAIRNSEFVARASQPIKNRAIELEDIVADKQGTLVFIEPLFDFLHTC